ncbi:aminoalkylphosphonate N-acetyltransferase [Enterobacillus tribolii]|uniref:GNAT family acetyltransferase n=1 Tax=Enterobacillus tribolii TaxID=1487935 RepID=A0A370R198_9GAMM|nr:aminoalkylphosphonate N-acetyltransferase [Enterobacillus tribolii]MBW7982753.1 aminoalkylphosphonate N-acetyltransferase [Enterobacillus tribolii]RDK95685.1 GNAT family acetyltransferase [Enterobacillus tribolii]
MHDSSPITLRAATSADTEYVYALICELEQTRFDFHRFSAGYLNNLADPHLYYALAWEHDRPLGFISLHLQFHLHHANWIAEIQELVVAADARGKGVGKRLLGWAETTARKQGAEQTELSTSVRRHDAHRFYQREGYKNTHLRFTKPLPGE